MKRTLALLVLALGALVQASAQGSSQTANQAIPTSPASPTSQAKAAAAVAAPVMPSDPNALMLLAARVNGLGSADMKPWHLKASYQTFDADGKPKDQGVFEEWWAGPEKYKISYASTGFNQVQYRDGDKRATTGDAGAAPLPERMVEEYFVHPLPSMDASKTAKYRGNNEKIDKITLKCVEPESTKSYFAALGESYCFDQGVPVIRMEKRVGDILVLFNNDVRLNGQYYLAKQLLVENTNVPVVKQLLVVHTNVPIVSADITSLDFSPTLQNADLEAPATATFAPLLAVDSAVIAGRKISGKNINYPQNAKDQRTQGTVLLDARISKTGTITDLQVISGPSALRQSSVDAVKTWKFQPYLLNGEPTEVETQVSVVYKIGE